MRFRLIPRRGLRLKLTLLFGAILGVTLMVFSLFVYSAFVREQDLLFDTALYNHAVDTAQGMEVSPFGDVFLGSEIPTSSGKIFPFQIGKSFVQVRDRKGNVIARSSSMGTAELPLTQEDVTLVTTQGAVLRTLGGKDLGFQAGLRESRYRLITYLVQPSPFAQYLLQIGVSLHAIDAERKQLRTFFMIAIPVTLLIAMMGGFTISGSALKPVAEITSRLRELSAHQLNQRLPIPTDEEELKRLTETLNQLLDRLERAFLSQERFVSDASHQLRTPLAILKGELDVLRKKTDRSPAEIAEFFDSASQEIDYLSRIVQDLLILARVDSGATSLRLEHVRLDEVAMDVISRLQKLADRKNVRIKLDLIADENPSSTDFSVTGETDLLQSVVQNLIDNAIKYSPEDTLVEVRIVEKSEDVEVAVTDHGPGITPEIRERIFDRFFRGEDSVAQQKPTKRTSGFGLGLAIAHRIIIAHGSQIHIESTLGAGSTFSFRMKKV